MTQDCVEADLRVINQLGLHGRASARMVELARRYSADVRLVRDGEEVDCKSILDVMTMACTMGTPVKIRACGSDAAAAVAALTDLVNNKFGEE